MNTRQMRFLDRSRAFAAIAMAIGVAFGASAQGIDPLVNGEALVRLVDTASITDFNTAHGSTTLHSVVGRNIHLVLIPIGVDAESWKSTADADIDTVWVELNYYGQVPEARGRCFYTAPSPNVDEYLNQPAWDQIGLQDAQLQTRGAGRTIAVVDSGIDATHITLANAVVAGGWNFVENNANTADVGNGQDDDGDGDIDEMTGHGTHVAGILRMIVPDADLMPIKVLDSEGASDNFILAQGIFHAIDQGVDVINISVGSTYNSDAVLDAVLEAQSRGIVVVAAGGNIDARLPLEYPAMNTGVIGVAGVDADDVKGWYSSYHENMAICAPGVEIFSTFPGDRYTSWDGTSMATPMVAGVATMVLSRHPEWPADESRVNNVRLSLMQSADSVDPLNPTYAGMLGAGRLRADRALDEVNTFTPAVDYAVGGTPAAVIAANLDGDRARDLVVAKPSANAVSVFLHDGREEFAPPVDYAVGAGPEDLTRGDFDGDGDRDLAVMNAVSGTVTILYNDGAGVFPTSATFAGVFDPTGIVRGDFDGNGSLDLALTSDDLAQVRILTNDGSGAFSSGPSHAVGLRPQDLAVGDLNGDGRLDIVTVNRDSNSISVLLNSASGFNAAQHFSVGLDPRALTLGDLDGDGDIDAATANRDSRDMTVAYNNGVGSFWNQETLAFPDGRAADRLAAGDLNGDGLADLIASNNDENISGVALFLARPDGGWFHPVNYTAGAAPEMVIAADIDRDRDQDIVVVNTGGTSISVLTNLASFRRPLEPIDIRRLKSPGPKTHRR